MEFAGIPCNTTAEIHLELSNRKEALLPVDEEPTKSKPNENPAVTLKKKEELTFKLTLNKQIKEEPFVYQPIRLHLNGPHPTSY